MFFKTEKTEQIYKKKVGNLKNIVYKFVLAKLLKLTQKYVLA